jgi:DNA-binding beta-propeller fold protein YncE
MILKTLFDTKKALLCFALCVLTAFCANAFGASRLANNGVARLTGTPNYPTVFNDGPRDTALFNSPSSVVFNNSGAVPSMMYVADTYNQRIRALNLVTNAVTTIAGSGTAGWADGTGASARFNAPTGITIDSTNSNLYVADKDNSAIRKINIST